MLVFKKSLKAGNAADKPYPTPQGESLQILGETVHVRRLEALSQRMGGGGIV